MADIELVVKISEEVYKKAKETHDTMCDSVWLGIKYGMPLPKGHGALIDISNIDVIELEDSNHIIRHIKGDEVDVYISAPIIIEADAERDKE